MNIASSLIKKFISVECGILGTEEAKLTQPFVTQAMNENHTYFTERMKMGG